MIVQDSIKQAVPAASSLSISTPARATPARVPAADSAVSSAQVKQAVPVENLSKAIATVNESLNRAGSSLQFVIDSETDVAVVSMVDAETGEVIRQIPSEEALAITRAIDEMLQQMRSSCGSGILCKQTA